MTINQIVSEQMKEFDTFIQALIYYTQDTDEPIDNQYYKNHLGLARDIVNKYTRKLIESLAEEIKLNKQKGEGDSSEQPVSFGYVMGYNKAVDDFSLKVKEILQNISK